MDGYSADLVVVGDGLVGKAIAWEAARRGVRTCLLGDGGGKASDAAAGMLAPSFETLHERASATAPGLLDEALALWGDFAEALERQSGQVIDYHVDGIIGVGAIARRLRSGKAIDTPEGFVGLESILVPTEGQVDPRRTGAALDYALRACGVRRVVGRGVGVRKKHGDRRILVEGGPAITADAIVLATGYRSLVSAEPARGVRGRAAIFETDSFPTDRVVRTEKVYFCPKRDGSLYVGATEEPIGGADGAFEGLIADALAVYPPLGTGRVKVRLDGIRPILPSGSPAVGPVKGDHRLLSAGGHDRNGVLLTPWTAREVANLLGY